MIRIKICGIKNEEHALAAARAGADFIGLVFAQSPRQVRPARAEKIVAALKKEKARTKTVGVFVNARAGRMDRIADACRLDWVQLSGDEPWETCRELGRPVIKVVRVSRNFRASSVNEHLAYGHRLLGRQKHIFLLDANVREKYGGTGMTFSWDMARPIAARFPVIVAGGLTPENVAEAIKIIRPWGVDVSSGVETGGVKDVEKILKFIAAAREADAA